MTTPVDNYFDQGLTYLDEGEYEAAVDMFTRALRLSLGDLAEVLVCRGVAYAHQGDFKRALADMNEALRQNPYMADAYNERGSLLRFQEDYENAIHDYTAAVRIDPSHYEAYYNRALAYEALGDLEAAEADLTRALAINNRILLAYEMRGRVRVALSRYDDGIADLQRYLRLGGGREYDNHSEIQSLVITLQFSRFLRKLLRLKT